MTLNTESIRAAGVRYNRARLGSGPSPLRRFAEELINAGVSVGGVVQENLFDDDGAKCGIDAIDLISHDRVPIARNTPEQLENKVCTLNNQKLADVSGLLRRILDGATVELLVVEKFGEQEQMGRGLAGEILAAMERDIPILVAVPDSAVEEWRRFTGDMAPILEADDRLLNEWWDAISQRP